MLLVPIGILVGFVFLGEFSNNGFLWTTSSGTSASAVQGDDGLMMAVVASSLVLAWGT